MADIIVLNEITELLNNMNNGLSTSVSNVKSVVDTINTNINDIKTNVATNNTGSVTGTLSQKLTTLLNCREKIVVGDSTNVKTLSNSLTMTVKSNLTNGKDEYHYSYSKYLNFQINYNGNIRIYCTASATSPSTNHDYSDDFASEQCVLLVKNKTSNINYEKVVVSMKNNTDSANSTSAYITIPISAGDFIEVRVAARSYCDVSASCVGGHYTYGITVDVTDVSVRCTTQDRTSPIITL